MTKDEISSMAREAGIEEAYSVQHGQVLVQFQNGSLERFAALVAQKEREAMVAEAAKMWLAMKNEDPFEDYVREIANNRARKQGEN